MSTGYKAALAAIVVMAIAVVVLAVGYMNNNAARPQPTEQDRAQVVREWNEMDPVMREFACDVFLVKTENNDLTEATNGYEQAGIDLMEGTCVDE